MYLEKPLETSLRDGRPFEGFYNIFNKFIGKNNMYLEKPLKARLWRGRTFERFNRNQE